MNKSIAMFALLTAMAGSAFAQQPPAKPAPAASVADAASVDAVIAALYDTISGPAGKARDWDRLRALFRADGKMIVHGRSKEGVFITRVLSVEDYIARVTPLFAKEGFFESELARRTEQFGQIAHVFSTYESRHAKEEAKPFQRGINSIQLVNDGRRWWVQSLVWQAETDGNPLPERYLGGR
ncbi:hypothetical protein [Pseudoduganella umbonata]|uniref:Nuclear transport factor 2 family protein n=1 Tax=Pseudoduganella umbonata TaxID=864828 RepID=A0A7W5E8H9_9BURK|nr:hypothetical protein [Pseudoduganella umbonata]MBB3220639.1 hypothetical protein [Pseudoduganella umbonata]